METKLQEAKKYLRERGTYRGDISCTHRYTPHDPKHLEQNNVTVTVCSRPSITVTHSTRG